MLFFNYSFLGGKYSADITPTSVNNLNVITLKNGMYNNLFITRNIVSNFNDNIQKVWDMDTVLYATFNGSLSAGNVEYTVAQVSSVRIKRKKINTFDWTTLFEIPIYGVDSFNFERFDRYAAANTMYDYALVPVMNNIEGNINVNSVMSTFDGIWVVEKTETFNTEIEPKIELEHIRPSVIVQTIGSKYPFVVHNTSNNYDSGNASGVFLKKSISMPEWDLTDSYVYRNDLNQFLCNGKSKILKFFDGRIWLVGITNGTSESEEERYDCVRTTFQWVEIGKYDSNLDLYNNGLVDVNIGSVY